MKKKFVIILQVVAVISFLSSCINIFHESITGNGRVVSERREIEEFDILDVSSGLEVFITFGEKPSLEIVADANLLDVINTRVENNRLRIRTDVNIRRAESKKINITVPSVSNIEVSGAASVIGSNSLKTDELEIEISSAGKIFLTTETSHLEIDINSAANAEIKGSTDNLQIEVSSAGKLNAGELVSKNCKVNVTSAGYAEVNVLNMLEAEANSAGSIFYSGNPEEKRFETSSAGTVSEK